MNKTKINFSLDIALAALLILILISIVGGDRRGQLPTAATLLWETVHYLSGTLIVIGSALHLILHWDWIKAIVLRRPKNLAQGARANRRIDLWLFGLFLVCALTGFASLALPTEHEWHALHRLSAMATLIVLGFHLVHHWKWIALTTKRYLGLAANKRAM